MEPDVQLVQQCLRGDGFAWEELVKRHTRRVYNLCYRFTGNRQESEDMTQEVFLKMFKQLGTYRAVSGGFTTWMTSVTRNLLIDHYRRTKQDRVTDSMDDEESSSGSRAEQIASQARTPYQMAHASELSQQVQRALGKLSPDLREAVILRDLQGLEYTEIQQVLRVPEGTVKSRINRGRIELAKILQQLGIGPLQAASG